MTRFCPRRAKLLVATLLSGMCITPSEAQVKYSLNTVAYVDLDLVAGSNLVANPLSAGDNSISNLFRAVPAGSFCLIWDRSSQSFGPTNSYVENVGWVPGTPQPNFLPRLIENQ